MKWTNIVCSFLCIIALVLSCVSASQVKVIKGEPGEQGIQGIQGIQGEKGEKGDKGDQGIQGVAGLDGRDGIDGVDGKDGKDGIDGKDGRDGIDGKDGIGQNGEKGDKGDKGDKGTDGRNGRDGKDGTIVTIDSEGYWCLDGVRTQYMANCLGNTTSHAFGSWYITYKPINGSKTTKTVEWQVMFYGDLLSETDWTLFHTNLIDMLNPTTIEDNTITNSVWSVIETVGNDIGWQVRDILNNFEKQSDARNTSATIIVKCNGYTYAVSIN